MLPGQRKVWQPAPRKRKYRTLSPRHLDVLKAWWAGESGPETAERLGIKLGTVRFYRDQARLRLNCAPNLQSAIKRAITRRLISRTIMLITLPKESPP
jgi:DNA-binding NarL/FixJ family response regulator